MLDEDFWKPFGEMTWRELAETAQASELQLKFAVARFNGATASGAAKIAGYAGDDEALRRAGYSAVRSAAVVSLIELAEANAPQAAGLTDDEVDRKVAKLVRSPDPQISLKATELFDRRKQREKERELEARQRENEIDIHEELRGLREISPELAAAYCKHKGLLMFVSETPKPEVTNG
jgi:hypothetical protein